MTATTLLFLSLGYIPKPNDQARYFLGIPEEAGMPKYMTYPSDDSTESGNYSVVWKFKEGEEILDLDPNESVMTELGINRPRIYEFMEVRAQQNETRLSVTHCHLGLRNSNIKVWMNRTELASVFLAILQLDGSAQSFLYKRDPRLLDKASGPNSESSSVAFSFDFPAVLGHELDGLRDFQAEGNADGLPLKLSYPEVIAACLRGYIKVAMWIMAIPSQDLFAFYAQLDTVVHIAARIPVAPMSADQDQEVQWPPALNSPTEVNVESP
ncbi:hypothetical protein BGZ61DRAFT_539770 [Ilyonectria robusta]|uniref:uncharacterized protein n=1 Tax=Ilyonectria robusta TaxID=1079257 RepID=UPI001E8E2171|nr:uncharacterized protein BGZ61DRAFT_539770 [Ilyonectria robusta]KAH8661114.1 hypothetical protein BGZ61DRAFT_539770 [Ilyonectria robusta]